MFESLSERLSGVFGKLTRAGALTEADVQAALVSKSGRARRIPPELRRILGETAED